MANFTHQSATARETQNGTMGPMPKSAPFVPAQDTSPDGSRKLRAAENATVKKIALSRVEPTSVDTSGARHHAARRNRLKIVMSSNWPITNAVSEPMAMRNVVTPGYCAATTEQIRPATKPANTTRRAAAAPYRRLVMSLTHKAYG